MFLAGGAVPPLIEAIGYCLLLAGVLSVIFAKLRVPTIAAFLAGGVIVGPIGGNLVTDRASIETIAGLGLILLLFLIGLEIDLRKLLKSGKPLVLTGLLQFPLCVAFGFAVTWGLASAGWDSFAGQYTGIYVGIVAAASSTLLVVKLFQDTGQLDTIVGRVSLGVLIFQDVWAIVVLALQPNFADPQLGKILFTFLDIIVVTAIAMAAARWVLPVVFHWIARLPELLLVAALGWCFGVGMLGAQTGHLLGYLGLHLDMSISLEMGALIAGATIAGKPFTYELMSKVSAVRDFFVTLFFVGLGMSIPAPDGIDVLLMAAALAAISVLARYVVFLPLMYATGLDRRQSFVAGTRLAQISEFCLVIAYIGMSYGHVNDKFVAAVIFAFVLTALITPALFKGADRLHDALAPLLRLIGLRDPSAAESGRHEAVGASLVILGFHRVASSLLHEIEKTRPELLPRTLVVDFNTALHPAIKARGAKVKYGDFSNLETLHHIGIEGAHVLLCTVPDDILKGTSNLKLAQGLRKLAPHAVIIVNALRAQDAKAMYEAGADYVYLQRVETAHALMPALEAALAGEIKGYIEDHQFRVGNPLERQEVLP
ncbi:MAG: cation:proton antiporter [Planctomycetes bacterium]|nr:cation:proton antiporter [Planctomycetota bacterium]